MKFAGSGADQVLIKEEPGTLIWSEPMPGGGRAVVKMYRRRPLHDPLRRLFVPYRVEREFAVLAHLWRQDLPCPEPLWWSHGRDRTHGRHELLATREIAGTITLVQWLAAAGAGPDLAPVFRLARRMHEAGISHGAFYPTNILVSATRLRLPAFQVLDMAHACRFSGSIVGTRPADFDLLDMLRVIERRHPLKHCDRWIAGYGLDVAGVERLLERLARHRIKRPWRHLHRAETDTRAAWDRVTRPVASLASGPAPQTPPHTRAR